MPLCVGQVSWHSPGFSADLEEAREYQGEKTHNLLWTFRMAYGVMWGLKPKVVY